MTRKLFKKYDEETEQWLLQDIRDERDEDLWISFKDFFFVLTKKEVVTWTCIYLYILIIFLADTKKQTDGN